MARKGSRSASEAPSDALARAEKITGPCSCHEAYKSRGLIAPDCIYHDLVEDIAEAIAASPSPWREMESAPKDDFIWVWCPPVHGLTEIVSLCRWHDDAGFCVDELRHPELWQPLHTPSPPSEGEK